MAAKQILDSRRTIVLLSEQYHPKVGGAVRYVDGLVAGLSGRGYDVKLIVPASPVSREGRSPPKEREERQTETVHVIRLRTEGDVWGEWKRGDRKRFVRRVQRVLENEVASWDPWAIHVAYGHYLYKAVQGLSRWPTFWTIHNLPPAESQPWLGRAKGVRDVGRNLRSLAYGICSGLVNRARICVSDYDCVVAVSQHVAKKLMPVPLVGPVEIVGEGVSAQCCDVTDTVNTPRAPDKTTQLSLLTVAGVVPHKCQHVAVDAAKLLNDRGLSFHWRLVGPVRDSAYAARLMESINRYGLSERIELLGPADPAELCKAYLGTDLYVHVSIEEGYCLAVLEALAHGRPVVGTPTGAIPELVSVGHGILAERSEGRAVANAILRWIRTPAPEEGSASLAHRIRSTFSWGTVANRMADIYEKYQPT